MVVGTTETNALIASRIFRSESASRRRSVRKTHTESLKKTKGIGSRGGGGKRSAAAGRSRAGNWRKRERQGFFS